MAIINDNILQLVKDEVMEQMEKKTKLSKVSPVDYDEALQEASAYLGALEGLSSPHQLRLYYYFILFTLELKENPHTEGVSSLSSVSVGGLSLSMKGSTSDETIFSQNQYGQIFWRLYQQLHQRGYVPFLS